MEAGPFIISGIFGVLRLYLGVLDTPKKILKLLMVATHEMPQGYNVANNRRGPEKHLGKWKKKEPKRKRSYLHLFNILTIPAHDWCQHSFSDGGLRHCDPLCHRLSWGQWELQQNTHLCQWRAVSRCWLKQGDPERASLWGGYTVACFILEGKYEKSVRRQRVVEDEWMKDLDHPSQTQLLKTKSECSLKGTVSSTLRFYASGLKGQFTLK